MLVQDKKKKKEHQRATADLIELFGVVDTEKVIAALVSAIQGTAPSAARFLYRKSWRVSVWEMQVGAVRLQVEYDKHRKELQQIVVATA